MTPLRLALVCACLALVAPVSAGYNPIVLEVYWEDDTTNDDEYRGCPVTVTARFAGPIEQDQSWHWSFRVKNAADAVVDTKEGIPGGSTELVTSDWTETDKDPGVYTVEAKASRNNGQWVVGSDTLTLYRLDTFTASIEDPDADTKTATFGSSGSPPTLTVRPCQDITLTATMTPSTPSSLLDNVKWEVVAPSTNWDPEDGNFTDTDTTNYEPPSSTPGSTMTFGTHTLRAWYDKNGNGTYDSDEDEIQLLVFVRRERMCFWLAFAGANDTYPIEWDLGHIKRTNWSKTEQEFATIIDEADHNDDGVLDICDDLVDVRAIGFSYGGWSALTLAKVLDRSRKVKDNNGHEVRLGFLDPVRFMRFGFARLPGNVVNTPVNYYQRNGCWHGCGGLLPAFIFRGTDITGCTNTDVSDDGLNNIGDGDFDDDNVTPERTPDHTHMLDGYNGYASQVANSIPPCP